jgi:hypothetical protein
MTPIEFVRDVASNYDHQELVQRFKQALDDSLCEAILWGETTFPFKRINSDNPVEIEDDFRKQLIEFFDSGTLPGQRQEEIIKELCAKGEWPGG